MISTTMWVVMLTRADANANATSDMKNIESIISKTPQETLHWWMHDDSLKYTWNLLEFALVSSSCTKFLLSHSKISLHSYEFLVRKNDQVYPF